MDIKTILNNLFGPGTWGTGGNMVAWILCGTLTMTSAYFLRGFLGKRLASWFHGHHKVHLRGELDALEARLMEYMTLDPAEIRERLKARDEARDSTPGASS